jgi:hypothetical protein
LTIAELGMVLWVILVVSVVLQPMELGVVQLLEGYWHPSWMGRVRRMRTDAYRARREQHKEQQKEDDPIRARHATWFLRHRLPLPESMMATALGNVLRAAERRAGERYGLDTTAVWPRLYPVIEGRLATVLADQRNQLDLTVRLCMVFLTLGVVYLVTSLAQTAYSRSLVHSWWIGALAIIGLSMSWLSYRGAVGAAESYGIGMEAAFDLHRFDLLAALHLPLPLTRAEEMRTNTDLSKFLQSGRGSASSDPIAPNQPNFRYRHLSSQGPRGKEDGSE